MCTCMNWGEGDKDNREKSNREIQIENELRY